MGFAGRLAAARFHFLFAASFFRFWSVPPFWLLVSGIFAKQSACLQTSSENRKVKAKSRVKRLVRRAMNEANDRRAATRALAAGIIAITLSSGGGKFDGRE